MSQIIKVIKYFLLHHIVDFVQTKYSQMEKRTQFINEMSVLSRQEKK